MKEELLRVLNKKLDDIKEKIASLIELNKKIDEENEKNSFVEGIIGLFKEDKENNLMSFVKIEKDDFARVLDVTGEDVKKVFDSESCNYDGLVYLISGINNGVSITLTDEQKNAIEYLITALEGKKAEIDNTVKEYETEKEKYEISDVKELKSQEREYNKVLDGIDKNEYLKDIDLLKEAIGFSELKSEETIDLLTYVLEYNAKLYKSGKTVKKEKDKEKEEAEEHKEKESKEENKEDEKDFMDFLKAYDANNPLPEEEEEPKEENKEDEKGFMDFLNAYDANNPLPEEETEEVKVEEPKEEVKEEKDEFNFRQVENENMFDLPNITFDDEVKPEEVKVEEPKTETEIQEINPEVAPETPVTPVEPLVETPAIPVEEITLPINEEPAVAPIEPLVEPTTPEVEVPPVETPVTPEVTPATEETVDSDFKDVINEKVDYETREKQEEEKTSTRELHKIFGKYGIEENVVLNELIDGNVTEYQQILDSLKDHNILDYFKKNKELLVETLLYSNVNIIDRVLKIIKEDLSVDDEDYGITLKIVINTIPSIFIKEGGNYDNFIQNVELFKDLELNLINLFDFSKEIFVADNEHIRKNLDIVNKYDFDINYKNAKYFLLIPNIAEKLDYYIESVYEDKTKNTTFDGITYIKEYAPKLNVVTDETIKRLRYASSNGQKVFGNKPGSLSGEITNLKVHALSISDEYMKGFFNNEFTNITSDEVREYVKLVDNSTNVGDYSDELEILNTYRNGLRYVIEGVNVSYNKVLRNYNVLRSYGIDAKKALHFAVCYNLVITKDEYNKVNELLDKIGGNA